MPIVVQKFGGTSVGSGGTDTSGRRPGRAYARSRQRRDRRRVRDGGHDRRSPGDGGEIDRPPRPPRAGHAPHGRRADPDVAARDRAQRPRLQAASTPARRPGSSPTRSTARRRSPNRPKRVQEALAAGNVVILAGFQGFSSDYEITTLGRGGSDLTAVAMAGAVGAASARSTPTWTASTRPTLGSSGTPGRSSGISTTRCWSWRRRARGCCSRGRWRWPADGRAAARPLGVRGARGTWRRKGTRDGRCVDQRVALDADEAKVTIDDVPDRPALPPGSSRRSPPKASAWT